MSRKMLISTLPVLLAATLEIVPFANVAGLVQGTQTGKLFYFAFATLNGAKPHINNTILYTCLGNNYEALGNWKKIIEKGDAELLSKSKTHTDKKLNPIYKGTKEGAYRSVVLTAKFMLQKW